MNDKSQKAARRLSVLIALAAVITLSLSPIFSLGHASAIKKSDQWCYSLSSVGPGNDGGGSSSLLPHNLRAKCFPTEFQCQQSLEDDANAASGQENCERQSLGSSGGDDGDKGGAKSDQWCYSLSSVQSGGAGGSGGSSLLPRNLQARCFPTEPECQQALENDSNAASGQENCERQSLGGSDNDTGNGGPIFGDKNSGEGNERGGVGGTGQDAGIRGG